jgi:Tfp pilus assembly protein PilF
MSPRVVTSFILATSLILLSSCRSAAADSESADTQKRFGVRMAKMDLWREAMFRFQRAVQINPNDAMSHNNLAVAYEANGDFDAALKEYREAMRLDRSNQYIQKNYSRLVEFQQRGKKRAAAPASAADSKPTATPPAAIPSPKPRDALMPPSDASQPNPPGSDPTQPPPPRPPSKEISR